MHQKTEIAVQYHPLKKIEASSYSSKVWSRALITTYNGDGFATCFTAGDYSCY